MSQFRVFAHRRLFAVSLALRGSSTQASGPMAAARGRSRRQWRGGRASLGFIALVLAAVGSLNGAAAPSSVSATHTTTFTDIDQSQFKADIEWLSEQHITGGCHEPTTAPRFCPLLPVTREQMASFIARAFSLPATTTDYFADDTGSVHEGDINSLAESGITAGCGTDDVPDSPTLGQPLYCPSQPVAREQMASFLIRALHEYWHGVGLHWVPENLPEWTGDRFTDDEASVFHETDINALATVEVTRGCNIGGTLYCPTGIVTREQMAAFLHRAIGTTDVLPRTGEAAVIGADVILGRDHDVAVAQSSSGGTELAASTYRIIELNRVVNQTSTLKHRAATAYSLHTLADVDVDYQIGPLFGSCSFAIDSTEGSDVAVTLHTDFVFGQPPLSPMTSIRFELETINNIGLSLEGEDFLTDCPADVFDNVRNQLSDILPGPIATSVISVSELCRGDDTVLFIPCPATP